MVTFLARAMADRERAERLDEPRGLRRRYPKTKNFYVTEALNSLLADHGLGQFCVAEAGQRPAAFVGLSSPRIERLSFDSLCSSK